MTQDVQPINLLCACVCGGRRRWHSVMGMSTVSDGSDCLSVPGWSCRPKWQPFFSSVWQRGNQIRRWPCTAQDVRFRMATVGPRWLDSQLIYLVGEKVQRKHVKPSRFYCAQGKPIPWWNAAFGNSGGKWWCQVWNSAHVRQPAAFNSLERVNGSNVPFNITCQNQKNNKFQLEIVKFVT